MVTQGRRLHDLKKRTCIIWWRAHFLLRVPFLRRVFTARHIEEDTQDGLPMVGDDGISEELPCSSRYTD